MAVRIDQNVMPEIEKTNEGYLRGQAIVTRTGVFIYQNADGSERRELRHPDDIITQESLNTLKNIPITLSHPPELVDSSNVDQYMVGSTGENVTIDGQNIMASLAVMNNDAVFNIEQNQKNQLSLGYSADLVEEQGEFRGMRYDYRQKNVVYNYLAVVNVARAGNDARLNLNSDSVARADQDENMSCQTKQNSDTKEAVTHNDRSQAMENDSIKINLDGTEYEVPQAVKERLDKKDSDISQLESEKTVVQARADELQNKVDSLNAEVKRLQESSDPNGDMMADRITEATKQRLDTLTKAAKFLNAENLNQMAERNDSDIKLEVIKKHVENFDASDKSQAYIDARFDMLCELSEKDGLKQQAQALGVKNDAKEQELDSQAKHKEAIQNVTQMYKRKKN